MAKAMGVSRSSLYYVPIQDKKDWALKIRMEEVLHEHPSWVSMWGQEKELPSRWQPWRTPCFTIRDP
jgi:hypothetical protein